MAASKILQWIAWAFVDGATPALTTARGCGGFVDNGVGDYQLELSHGIDATMGIMMATPITTALRQMTCVHTTDVSKQMLATTGAAGVDVAADTVFNVLFGSVYPAA